MILHDGQRGARYAVRKSAWSLVGRWFDTSGGEWYNDSTFGKETRMTVGLNP